MNKLWIAIGALAFVGVVAYGVRRKKQEQAKDDAVWVERQKEAIIKGLELCEQSDASFAATYAMATAHLASKAAVDPKATIKLIRDTVRPVLDTRETVCAGAETLATNYLVNHPDDRLRAARDQSRTHLARLRTAGKNLDKLSTALAKNASPAELGKLVTTATTAPK